jgi:hypothetical protein
MIKARRLLVGLICCLSALALFACNRIISRPSDSPVVVFDSPSEVIEGGQRLDTPDQDWDGFGEAVDVHGNLLVVGASEWNYYGAGSVYVYRLSGGEWQQEAQLTASDWKAFREQAGKSESQLFGDSVAVAGDSIAIGAPGNPGAISAGYSGAVYLFEYDGQTWKETAKLTPNHVHPDSTPIPVDQLSPDRIRRGTFGASIALDGDTLAIAGDAVSDDVYIYQHAENGWQEQVRIPIPRSLGKDLYITSMALSGDSLALSTLSVPPQSDQIEKTGLMTGNVTIHVFSRVGDDWQENFQFIPERGDMDFVFLADANIGASVAMEGAPDRAELLAVGLPGFPDWSSAEDLRLNYGVNPDLEMPAWPVSQWKAGAIYIFERSQNGGWNLQVTLRPAGWQNPPGAPSFLSRVPSTPVDGQANSIATPACIGLIDCRAATLEAQQEDFDREAFLASFVSPGSFYSEDPEVSFFGARVDLYGNQLAATAGYANATYVFERRGQEWVYKVSISPGRVVAGVWEDFDQTVAISGHSLLLGTPGEFGDSAYVFDLP